MNSIRLSLVKWSNYKFYFIRQLYVNLSTYVRKKVFENEANALFDNTAAIQLYYYCDLI